MTPALPRGFHIYLLTDTATVPTRGTEHSIGLDISASSASSIKPGCRNVVSTGLQFAIPAGVYGRVAPRSGLAVKRSVDVGAGVIDPDYRGELKVVLINNGKEDFNIETGDRIAQLILENALISDPIQSSVPLDDTARGQGGFGSTGKSARRRKRCVGGGAAKVTHLAVPPYPLRGIRAAIATAEEVLEECVQSLSEIQSQEAIQFVTDRIAAIQALPMASRTTRPSSKLSGFGHVFDLSSDGCLANMCNEYDSVTKADHCLLDDLLENNAFKLLRRKVAGASGCLVHVALPAPPSPYNAKKIQLMLQRAIELFDVALDNGGDIMLQLGMVDTRWLTPEVLALQCIHSPVSYTHLTLPTKA